MRKITLFFSLLVFGVVAQAQVVFDPNLYEVGTFQGDEKMQIVAINDAKYLKVTLSDWNSIIQVSATTLDASSDKFVAEAKFEEGTSGFKTDQVKTFIKIYGDAGDVGQTSGASKSDFSEYEGDLKILGGTVNGLQVAGQETVSWGAVTGDFIYLGVVKAVKTEIVNVESIHNNQPSELHVYPNPVSDILYVSNLENLTRVEIVSVNGSYINVTNEIKELGSFNVNKLRSGMYFIRAIENNTVYIASFVKE